MPEQQTFTERAADLRAKVSEIEAAPVFTKVKMAQDIATLSALLVADMAARLDAVTAYADEAE